MNNTNQIVALIVEDESVSRIYLRQVLGLLNIDVIEAVSGEEALELMKDNTADIFLLDIALDPDMDGIELCRRLREDNRFMDIPSIAVTAYAREKLEGYESCGFSDYLAKPYTPEELEEMLRKHLPHRFSSK